MNPDFTEKYCSMYKVLCAAGIDCVILSGPHNRDCWLLACPSTHQMNQVRAIMRINTQGGARRGWFENTTADADVFAVMIKTRQIKYRMNPL